MHPQLHNQLHINPTSSGLKHFCKSENDYHYNYIGCGQATTTATLPYSSALQIFTFAVDATKNYPAIWEQKESQNICSQSANFFINYTDLKCYKCNIPNCLLCYNFDQCKICDQTANYFINQKSTWPISAQCVLCRIPYCLHCVSLTQCLNCNQNMNYFVNKTDGLCYLCQIPQCLSCQSLQKCLIYKTSNFNLQNKRSLSSTGSAICGDNIVASPQQCDDGNLIQHDGCSSNCIIQPNFVCQPNPNALIANSICFYIGQIDVKVVYIEKVDYQNKIQILVNLEPSNLAFWNSVDFTSMITFPDMSELESYQIVRNADGNLLINLSYNASIHNKAIIMNINVSDTGIAELSRVSSVSISFIMVPNDNQFASYFDSRTYVAAKAIQIVACTIAAFSLLLFLIGMIGQKVVAVEMMAVIQIAYFSLLPIRPLHPSLKALNKIWFVNGLNIHTKSKDYLLDPYTSNLEKGLMLHSFFIQNCNFTIFMVSLPLLISLVIYILAQTAYKNDEPKQDICYKLSRKFRFQYAFCILVFSGYLIAFSWALQLKYGIKDYSSFFGVANIVLAAMMFLLFAIYSGLFFTRYYRYFGEFYYFFDKQNQSFNRNFWNLNQFQQLCVEYEEQEQLSMGKRIDKKWYLILMILKIGISFSTVFMASFKSGLLLNLSVFMMLIFYCLSKFPYTELWHNFRFKINATICVLILSVYIAYNSMQENLIALHLTWTYLPLLVCFVLIVCLAFSGFYIIRQLIIEIKRNKNENLIQKQQEMLNECLEREMKAMDLPNPNALKISSINPPKRNMVVDIEQIKKQIKGQRNIEMTSPFNKNLLFQPKYTINDQFQGI